jgi:asparagine synthase (glutamine-hydrolysing)
MCGILGQYLNDESVDLSLFDYVLNLTTYRGPDRSNRKVLKPNVVFGHNRLSIIDTSSQSDQPFSYGEVDIVFNGEIFNYLELREDLMAAGYSFTTTSDTEVLCASYLAYGMDCVKYLNGMWAFVIFDHRTNSFFGSRDRLGIKPFYYLNNSSGFSFSSEAKSIFELSRSSLRPNYGSIVSFLVAGTGSATNSSWFSGVEKLPPGYSFSYSNGNFSVFRHWFLTIGNYSNYSKEDLASEYYSLLKSSVKLRLRSDVPVGLTLSGGLDSSSIAYLVSKEFNMSLNAYTAIFPGKDFDESGVAKEISNLTNHNFIPVEVSYDNFLEDLISIVYHLDAGHSSPAVFPLYKVTKEAKNDVTVFLEGQGADELLGGYVNSTFIPFIVSNLLKNYSFSYSQFKKLVAVWGFSNSLMLTIRQLDNNLFHKIVSSFHPLNSCIKSSFRNHGHSSYNLDDLHMYKVIDNDFYNKILFRSHRNGLVNLLHYGDSISMMNSLENRLPFCDYRLVNFVFSVDKSYKLNDVYGKYLHRLAFDGRLPNSVNWNVSKLGFVSSLDVGLNSLKVKNYISEGLSILGNILDIKKTRLLLNNYYSGNKKYEREVFKILQTIIWFNRFSK